MDDLEQRYRELAELAEKVKKLGHAPDPDRLRELGEEHERLDDERQHALLDPDQNRALRRLSAAIRDYLAAARERDRQERAAAEARIADALHDLTYPTITSRTYNALASHRDRSHDRGYSR